MKPVIVIVEPATGVTGSFVAAKREAECLRNLADVVLVIAKDAPFPEADLDAFSDVVRLPNAILRKTVGSVITYLPRLLVSGWRLARLLSQRGCSRLQINDYYLMQGAVARLFGYRGRLVTWVRIDPKRHGGAIGAIWLRISKAVSDELVSVSEHLKSLLPAEYRTLVIYDPAVAFLSVKSDPASRRFLFMGNYIEGKGQDLAVRAFNRVADLFPDAKLAFYGSDLGLAKNRAYRERLQTMVAGSPAANRITLNAFADDTSQSLRSAFAALNLSESESFSLTCQEASARGLPVIATRSGGPAEIIEDGITGFLVPVGDETAVAARMQELLREPRRAERMGQAGVKLMRERFSVEAFRQAVTKVFRLDG